MRDSLLLLVLRIDKYLSKLKATTTLLIIKSKLYENKLIIVDWIKLSFIIYITTLNTLTIKLKLANIKNSLN